MRKKWSEIEIQKLRKMFIEDGLSPIEIEPLLDRTRTSIKIKIQKLGLKHTDVQTKQIKSRLNKGKNNAMYGKKPWSKGLNKNNDNRILKASKTLSKTRKKLFKENKLPKLHGEKNPMYGKKSWNNGLTKEIDDRVLQYGLKGSKTKKKQWLNLSEKEKKEIRKHMAIIGSQCNKKLTKIELKVKEFLEECDIEYVMHFPEAGFAFDFKLDNGLIIECQGDYWHANPRKYNKNNVNKIQKKNIDRDKRKIKYLNDNNIPYLFFWEFDINRNFENIKKIVKENYI